jgi:hypothetical protein
MSNYLHCAKYNYRGINMKKIVSFLLFSLIIFTLGNTFNAQVAEYKPIKISEVKTETEKFLKQVQDSSEEWKTGELSNHENLYDFDGNLVAYLFPIKSEGNDQGYVISSANPDFPGVIESTREGQHPYQSIVKGKLIYVGPLMYYVKNGSEFVDIKTNQTYSLKEFKSKGPLAKDSVNKYSKLSTVQNTQNTYSVNSTSGMIISNVPDYTWRKGCFPTSAANMLVWFAQYGGKSNLVNVSSNELIDTLAIHMKTDASGGTKVPDAENGIISYAGSKGYYTQLTRVTGPTFIDFKDSINTGKPNLITTAGHPTYSDHAMTGIGYETYGGNTILVRDTWSTTAKDVWLNWSSYFDYVIKVNIF